MKKWIALILVIVTALSLGGCGGRNIEKAESTTNPNNETKFDSKQIYGDYSSINEDACAIEDKYATDGFVQFDSVSAVMDELETLAKNYYAKGIISSYEKQATSIYFKLRSGIGYLYAISVQELMSGDEIGEVLTIEPYAANSEFIGNWLLSGKSPDKSAEHIATRLPDLYIFPEDDNWDSFSFEQAEKMRDHQIIIWYGHGGFVNEFGSVLGTSVPITDVASLLLCQPELSRGELILGKEFFLVTPIYFERNIQENALEGSLIFLNACQSAMDNRLANALISKGARLVVGNSHSIRIRYMLYMMDDFFYALTNRYDDGTYWTAEDALAYAKRKNGDTDSRLFAYGAEVKLIYPENECAYRLTCTRDTSIELPSEIECVRTYYDGTTSFMKAIPEYDAEWNLVGVKTYVDGVISNISTYDKDVAKLLVSQDYDRNGKETSRIECTYDQNGNRLTYYSYNENGQFGESRTYRYDGNNNMLSEITYYTETLYDEYQYTYTDDGKLESEIYTRGSSYQQWITYIYDEYGNILIEKNGSGADEWPPRMYTNVYEDGMLSEVKISLDGEVIENIKYNEDGAKILSINYMDGEEIMRTEACYHSGKLIEWKPAGDDRRVYEYNEQGDLVSVRYCSGSDVTREYTIKYETIDASANVQKNVKDIFSIWSFYDDWLTK